MNNNIKKIRTEQKLTITKLSELSKMSTTYISRLERNKENIKPSEDTKEKISKALNKSIVEVFGKQEEIKDPKKTNANVKNSIKKEAGAVKKDEK